MCCPSPGDRQCVSGCLRWWRGKPARLGVPAAGIKLPIAGFRRLPVIWPVRSWPIVGRRVQVLGLDQLDPVAE